MFHQLQRRDARRGNLAAFLPGPGCWAARISTRVRELAVRSMQKRAGWFRCTRTNRLRRVARCQLESGGGRPSRKDSGRVLGEERARQMEGGQLFCVSWKSCAVLGSREEKETVEMGGSTSTCQRFWSGQLDKALPLCTSKEQWLR